jgi:hypothetical protein
MLMWMMSLHYNKTTPLVGDIGVIVSKADQITLLRTLCPNAQPGFNLCHPASGLVFQRNISATLAPGFDEAWQSRFSPSLLRLLQWQISASPRPS